MTALAPSLMTTEQLLALPEDGVERELIRGQLRERPMTRRGRRHTRTAAKIVMLLGKWWDKQPEPRGEILVGEAGFRIHQNPDTTVGIDVVYVPPQLTATLEEDVYVIDGAPTLAVEILSPSDTQEQITDKVRDFLEAAIALVWVVEPVFRTVTVYRPDRKPELFNEDQELMGDPHLAGLRLKVADIF